MRHELTHASFFSGVGGLDLGLERAGWRTVSFSEIDPYASAVLAERWPGVPNLGDITALASEEVPAAEGAVPSADHGGGAGLRGRVIHRADSDAAGGESSGHVGLAPATHADARPAGSTSTQANLRSTSQASQDTQEIPGAGEADHGGADSGSPTARPGVPDVRQSGDGHRPHPAGSGWGTDGDGQPPTALPSVPRREVPSGLAWQSATLWSGGFPCTDLSVAGKRAGFNHADGSLTRSGLALTFLDLVERHRPPAILLENVPGLLSSNGGKDFGALLGRLGELGYWWAYRVLDAQFFGVPQRRRRVFICALHAGAGFGADSAAAVLSVGSRCDGHSAAGDAAREGVAPSPAPGPVETVGALPAGVHGFPDGVQEFMQGHFRVVSPPPDPGGVRATDGLAGRLDDRSTVGPILSNAQGGIRSTDLNLPLTLNGGEPADGPLLPLGLDSHRYRCCGNGVVSNVAEWVGVRLARAVTEAQVKAA